MEWISVKDRLPNEGDNVLLYLNNRRNCGHAIGYYQCPFWWGVLGRDYTIPIIAIYYDDGGQSELDSTDVTHWTPLPEPPKD